MHDTIIMLDNYLLAFIKQGFELVSNGSTKLLEFLAPWHGVDDYLEEFHTLKKNQLVSVDYISYK